MGLIFENMSGDLIAVAVACVALFYYSIMWKFNYWQRKGVKFLKPSIPFGNFQPVFMQKISLGGQMRDLYDQSTEPFEGMFNLWRPSLLIRDPELMRAVLVKDFASFQDRGAHSDETYDPLSGNLVLLGGEKWKNLRAKLTPTFTSGKLKGMFSTLVSCGNTLDKYIEKVAAKGDTIEVRETLAQYSTNIIASVAFGIEIDCISDPETPFRKVGRQIFESSIKNNSRMFLKFLFPSALSLFKIKSVNQEVEDFILAIVRQNMEYREINNVARKDFFQLLVQLRNTGDVQVDGLWDTKISNDESLKKLSIEECAAQAFVFFAAGFETSSTTMAFALYELAKNVDCQAKVQQEIDEVLREHNGEISYDSVIKMKYLDCVIDETLRKYPPFTFLTRKCNKPWTIPNTNTIIEVGSQVIMSMYGLHNDPKYYPEPEKFIPERFNAMNSKSFVERPYMPFGEGPRNCVAARMGKMQTKVGLVLMMRNYSYELAGTSLEPMKIDNKSFVLAPAGGVNVKITMRA